MTRLPDPLFDQRIADWLEDDPSDAPGHVLDGVLTALPSVARRKARRTSWRFPTVRASLRWPVAVAAVIGIVAVGGLLYGLQGRQPTAGEPSKMPTPSALSGSRPGSWTVTGSMERESTGHTATLLPNGKVLVAGGSSGVRFPGYTVTAELYDPSTGTWSATGNLITDRTGHTATLLPSGKVLVAGGAESGFAATASAELYDPASGTWTATGDMLTPRSMHTATLLPDGKVLVAGGYDNTPTGDLSHSPEIVATAELYDPASGTWTETGNMVTPRRDHSATLLLDGKVLVAGGDTNADVAAGGRGPQAIVSAELYDPNTGTWAATGTMSRGHVDAGATLLPDGTVLVENGVVQGNELYDPVKGSWTFAHAPDIGGFVTATLLRDGTVLTTYEVSDSELYDPATGSWTYMSAGAAVFGAGATATLLDDGNVLVAGGQTNAAELYRPGSQR